MDKLKELFKKSFDLWIKMRWLKEIDRAINRYNRVLDRHKKLFNKVCRERHIMNELIKEYNERYSANL